MDVMTNRRKLRDEDARRSERERLIADYESGRKSLRMLAQETGLAYGTVRKLILEGNGTLRRPGTRTVKPE